MLRLVAINVAVFVTLVAALEISVRLLQPGITPVGTDGRLFADNRFGATAGPRPLAVGMSNGAELRVDRNGFWAHRASTDTTKLGWLFLGDSVTMGMGVDPDSTFAGRFAEQLDSMRVLNPSIVGYTSRDYRNVLSTLVRTRHPAGRLARVTVFWCLNDVYAAVPDLSSPDNTVREFSGPPLTFIRRHYYTFQWMKALVLDRSRVYFEHDRRLYAEGALDGAFEDLTSIQGDAAAAGLRLDVVLLPYEYQLRHGLESDAFAPQRMLTDRLRAASIPVHDAAPYLLASGVEPRALYLYGDGIHFSAEGHRLLARFLEATLYR